MLWATESSSASLSLQRSHHDDDDDDQMHEKPIWMSRITLNALPVAVDSQLPMLDDFLLLLLPLSLSLSLCHFISPCLLSNFISSSVRQSTMKVLKLNEMKCCLDRFWPFSLPLFPSLCLSLRLSNLPQCLAQLASLPLSLNNLVSKYLLFALACFGQMTFDTLLWYYYCFLVALIYWKSQYLWLAKKSENIKGVTMALTAKWSPY